VTNDAVDFVRGYAASGDALSQLDSTSQTAVTRAKGHAILEQQAFPKLLAMLQGHDSLNLDNFGGLRASQAVLEKLAVRESRAL
jgi:hypothetical protein